MLFALYNRIFIKSGLEGSYHKRQICFFKTLQQSWHLKKKCNISTLYTLLLGKCRPRPVAPRLRHCLYCAWRIAYNSYHIQDVLSSALQAWASEGFFQGRQK